MFAKHVLDWLSMVLRLRQHNIGYKADSFTGLMTQPTVSKHWRRVVSHPDRPQSNQAHLTVLQYYKASATSVMMSHRILMAAEYLSTQLSSVFVFVYLLQVL